MAAELIRVPKHRGRGTNYLDPAKIDRKTRREWSRHRRGGGSNLINSRKLDHNDPNLNPRDREMLDAIAKARLQNKDDNPRVNYEATRYIDGNGDERILVSKSDGMHSERVAINYLLDDGVPRDKITDLVTERSPCIKNPNCAAWMGVNTPGTNTNHLVDYQINENAGDNPRATRQVKEWINSVFAPNSRWRQ